MLLNKCLIGNGEMRISVLNKKNVEMGTNFRKILDFRQAVCQDKLKIYLHNLLNQINKQNHRQPLINLTLVTMT